MCSPLILWNKICLSYPNLERSLKVVGRCCWIKKNFRLDRNFWTWNELFCHACPVKIYKQFNIKKTILAYFFLTDQVYKVTYGQVHRWPSVLNTQVYAYNEQVDYTQIFKYLLHHRFCVVCGVNNVRRSLAFPSIWNRYHYHVISRNWFLRFFGSSPTRSTSFFAVNFSGGSVSVKLSIL